MSYFKINNNDYSMYVCGLEVGREKIFNSQTNAAGDTVADYIGSKREIEVEIIPLNDTVMAALLADLDTLNVVISFRNPRTNTLEENVACIIPDDEVEYYTIQADRILYNKMKLKFSEL